MPTNKQRREAARRHLERQLQRRIETDVKRKRRNLIITIVSSVVVVAVVVIAMVALVNDNKKKKTSAAATPSASASAPAPATDGAPVTPLTFTKVTVTPAVDGSGTMVTPAAAATPAAASPSASASAQPKTAGPCGYTQTATPATKDVGIPPDPSPTPSTNRVMSITTDKGPITMSLNAANAPCTVQSMTYLANKGYFDNTSCFRLVTSGIFVLQCGDPANTGTGGPGYDIKDENLDKADYSVVGTVAMANAGAGTDGSQFFIIYKDTSSLPKSYTVIGQVTTGMDIVQAVAAAGVKPAAAK